MRNTLLSFYGLKFHPFRGEIPHDAIYAAPAVESFVRRVEMTVADGGFALVSGDVGTGKSVALRLLAHRLRGLRDVVVGSMDYPQGRLADFYRELGDIFGVTLSTHNRWNSFKALRTRWADHITSTTVRPILIIDEAQEMHSSVINELRVLTSKDFDSSSLLCVVLAGDARLTERLREPELAPLGSRVRRRLLLDGASREQLLACLEHLLAAAGNAALMTPTLKATVVDHSLGNFRVMMNIADELLAAAAERQVAVLDEKLYFDVYPPPAKKARR
jgi:type II secretory pathway predicted ATPase ExeA